MLISFYYSTQTFLAWCLNHYFYNQTHYVYVGAPFYPYSYGKYVRNNPSSSNPYRRYGDFYQHYLENDHHHTDVQGYRNNLKKGVDANITDSDLCDRLLDICDSIHMNFFFPVIYRVNIEQSSLAGRKILMNSGAEVNSNEYLIANLKTSEFDILFADFEHETKLAPIFSQLWERTMNPDDVLVELEANFL